MYGINTGIIIIIIIIINTIVIVIIIIIILVYLYVFSDEQSQLKNHKTAFSENFVHWTLLHRKQRRRNIHCQVYSVIMANIVITSLYTVIIKTQ